MTVEGKYLVKKFCIGVKEKRVNKSILQKVNTRKRVNKRILQKVNKRKRVNKSILQKVEQLNKRKRVNKSILQKVKQAIEGCTNCDKKIGLFLHLQYFCCRFLRWSQHNIQPGNYPPSISDFRKKNVVVEKKNIVN